MLTVNIKEFASFFVAFYGAISRIFLKVAKMGWLIFIFGGHELSNKSSNINEPGFIKP